jgi:hypothetical protein
LKLIEKNWSQRKPIETKENKEELKKQKEIKGKREEKKE